MKNHLYILLLAAALPFVFSNKSTENVAQRSPSFSLSLLPVVDTNPVIKPVQKTVYLNPTRGNDHNNGRSRTTAVKTFQRAMELCSYGTAGIDGGHYYNEIRIAGGTHKLSGNNFFQQTWHIKGEDGSKINGQYRKRNPDGTIVYKDISIYGEPSPSACVLDGTGLKGLTSAWGVISLAGSNVSVKNITIQNSPASRGISIGTGKPYINSREDRLHDILIQDVHINSVGTFGINLDEVDRAVVRSSVVTNACMINANGKSYSGYPSALKCRYSTHVSFINNKVYNNWGEGLNFNKSSYCYGSNNVAYDNYAVNFYCDNATHTIVANNRLYNSANNRRFWKRV
ncbi:MAG: right-handed parallel beta-helix repeat-containing protein, partial [Niabella sp.]